MSTLDDVHDAQAAALLGRPFAELDAQAQRVARHIGLRQPITRHPEAAPATPPTRGQRAADAVTAFGGSWFFVGLFAAVMLAWVALNVLLLGRWGRAFDPYPFILLNLFLSMLAAVQAPIILMSQNRQSEKDRLTAGHDYEINLKAELEIMLLHDKLDQLREQQWAELLAVQAEQMRLLAVLAAGQTAACASAPTPSTAALQDGAAAGPAGRARETVPGLPRNRCGRRRLPCFQPGLAMNPSDLTAPPTPVTELAAEALNNAASQGGAAVRQLVSKAGDLTQRSVEQWRGQAEVWRDGTSEHIRAHPLRSVLIATGAGMVLALLVRGLSR